MYATGFKGLHLYTLTEENVRSLMIQIYVNELFFIVAHFFSKLPFLIFYYGLSPAPKYRLALYAVGVFVTIYTIAGLFVAVFQCAPVDWWNHLLTAKCIDRRTVFPAFASLSIVADVLLIILPMAPVCRLQLKWREKAIVIGIFGMGLL